MASPITVSQSFGIAITPPTPTLAPPLAHNGLSLFRTQVGFDVPEVGAVSLAALSAIVEVETVGADGNEISLYEVLTGYAQTPCFLITMTVDVRCAVTHPHRAYKRGGEVVVRWW